MIKRPFQLVYRFGFTLLFGVAACLSAYSQGVSINTTGATPNASAVLDVSSTNKGVLTPRMTRAQRDAIAGPATGLLIYQTDQTPGFRFFDGTDWVYLRGMESVPGRKEIDAGCGTTLTVPPAYTGFGSSYNCTNGTGAVTWPAGLFDAPPVVNMSSEVVPVPPPAPDIYCIPVYTAGCNTSFNDDSIELVRIYKSDNNIAGVYNILELDRESLCDEPLDGNYVAVPPAPASNTATLSANIATGCSGNFYQIQITSTNSWPDEVQAFIDWNADGDFVDAGELMTPAPSFGTSQGNMQASDGFEVPATALNGTTVMRCKSLYAPSNAALNNPCSGGTFGETEDYTLTIDCANSGPSPEIVSICTVTDVTVTNFEYRCSLLSGSPIAPPSINFELLPAEQP